jgi:NitT/TauT family transport system substrate-binding protein
MKRSLVTTFAVLAAFSVGFVSSSCQRDSSKPIGSIVVSYAPFETLLLLWAADEQGFFTRNGLNVTLKKYDTGAGALEGVLKGDADIAVGTAEFPLVGRAFRKEKIRTLGSVAKIEHIYVVARKDRGIERVSDLKGKRVGTTRGTVAEFYLGRMLELNGMKMQDLTVLDLKTPSEWVNAVVDGDMDAVVTAQPHANSARDGLGANAVFWSAQSNQPMYALAIATDEWIKAHPELVNRFLKSMAQAEEHVIRNPDEAKTIIQKRLDLGAAYVETLWSKNHYGLSLDQSLIAAMEDEARWMINTGLTSEKQIPDFVDYIHIDGLKAIKPEAVNIIR